MMPGASVHTVIGQVSGQQIKLVVQLADGKALSGTGMLLGDVHACNGTADGKLKGMSSDEVRLGYGIGG